MRRIAVLLLVATAAAGAIAADVIRRGPVPGRDAAATAWPADGLYRGMVPDDAVTAFGGASCGTTACHGGPQAGNHAVLSFAFTIWAKDDPHAGAYQSLHEPRSRRMAGLLGLGEAHRATVCLACHSMQAETPRPLPHELLTDGVACGSCHGDATHWRVAHTLPSWKALSAEERESLGYRDLASITERVRNCVPCHVGDSTREVDHDLVAAGHPRLAFEFSAYQRLWPRHWSPAQAVESRADFGARAWAVGQAETLRAVAALLAVRAERAAAAESADTAAEKKSADTAAQEKSADTAAQEKSADTAAEKPPASGWPEFSEFDCYACHRSLGPNSYAAGRAAEWRNPAAGVPAWQPWQAAATRLLSDATTRGQAIPPGFDRGLESLVSLLTSRWSAADPAALRALAAEARSLEQAAAAAAVSLEARERIELDISPQAIDRLVAARPPEWRSWDSAVQRVLALEAAVRPGPAALGTWPPGRPASATDTGASLEHLRQSLLFLPGQDGLPGFDPGRFRSLSREVPWQVPGASHRR